MKGEWKGGAGTESWETLAFQGGGGPERLEGLMDGHAPICSCIPQPCLEHLPCARHCSGLRELSSEQRICDPSLLEGTDQQKCSKNG